MGPILDENGCWNRVERVARHNEEIIFVFGGRGVRSDSITRLQGTDQRRRKGNRKERPKNSTRLRVLSIENEMRSEISMLGPRMVLRRKAYGLISNFRLTRAGKRTFLPSRAQKLGTFGRKCVRYTLSYASNFLA